MIMTDKKINTELIEELEKEINSESQNYRDQYQHAELDFIRYCAPGSVTNWTHPEKPPVQTSLAVLCKIFKPDRILDLGTGLTGVTFKKYFPEIESVCVDDSFLWIQKLFVYLVDLDLKHDNLYWFDGDQFHDISIFGGDMHSWMIKNPSSKMRPCKSAIDGKIYEVESQQFKEPSVIYECADVSKHSTPPESVGNLLDAHHTRKLVGYELGDEKFAYLCDPQRKNFSDLGKFNFVHYDMGGMRVRGAYLRSAIDMLDRSQDSIIYVDDLHKEDMILYENKSYPQIVDEIITERGGIAINCKEAMVDHVGGFGGLFYFPPLDDMADV